MRYLSYLSSIVQQVAAEESSQLAIAQKERNVVSAIENEHTQTIKELCNAEKVVREQYHSVWDSCTKYAGLRKPEDQRPEPENIDWKSAVRLQEHAALLIREWFDRRAQQAVAERQRKIYEEKERNDAKITAEAEAARKKSEEFIHTEQERGYALLERMRQKYRHNS
jgi:hypothetical protein